MCQGLPSRHVGSTSGVPQTAADLSRRPTWQPWARSGPQRSLPTIKRWSALAGTLQLPPTPTKAAIPPDGSRIAEPFENKYASYRRLRLSQNDATIARRYPCPSTIGPDKLHVIATSGEERDPLLKDVPTAKESGLPNYVVTSWNGVGAPAGVPAEIINALSLEIRRALASPDVRERMLRLGLEARGSTPEEMRNRMATDAAKWREVIEKAGIPRH